MLTSGDKELFCLLKSFNPSFPSYLRIRDLTGMAKATISKSLKSLKKLGLITYVKGNSFKKANFYKVLDETEWLIESAEIKPVQKLNQFSQTTQSLLNSEPVLVQKVDSNNPNIKTSNIKIPIGKDLKILEELKGFPLLEENLPRISINLQRQWLDDHPDYSWLKRVLLSGFQKFGHVPNSELEDCLHSLVKQEWENLLNKFGGPIALHQAILKAKSIDDLETDSESKRGLS